MIPTFPISALSAALLAGAAFQAQAVDAASLRQKLNRYYDQQGVELRTEQRMFESRQGALSVQQRQRLVEKFNRQRVEQQRLERRQQRRLAPSAGAFSAPGLRSGAPGRPRADTPTLQRFERRNRQQRFEMRTQRRSWR